jgi:2-polyprenyl-6-methoxyphenol hydroxylase-like FAD-dependent oxidoreductase
MPDNCFIRGFHSMNPPILICGAGPTGLVLAIWLAKRNIPFRIIDKAAEPGTASRALVLHARTLEFYRQLGLDKVVIEASHSISRARLWVKQHIAGTVRFSGVATDTTAFPYVLVLPQDEHEALLEDELGSLGVKVERNTELLSFVECPGGIHVSMKKAGAETENAHFSWLAGCDGAHSRVRELTEAEFAGGTSEHTFYVADVTGKGPVINEDLNIILDSADFLAVFPMKGEGRARLIGTVRTGGTWQDIRQDIFRRTRLDIKAVNWFSIYSVHHRVASFFRKGRVFLLGDAAHVHSPLGGQGMNTGIGDAVNLAWKLEAVLQRGAPDSILDTYEEERITFARRLVATTDRAFTFVNKKNVLATGVRTLVVPILLPLFFQRAAVRRYAFRLLSQTRITYRNAALNTGILGVLLSGDRLPWLRQQDNYASLKSLDWQLHCYGDVRMDLLAWCERRNLELHFFLPAKPIRPGTLCLVRPDGHIGWIGYSSDLAGLTRYMVQWGIAKHEGA